MDDELLRRIVGVVTLMLVALLLSRWLPSPDLQRHRAPDERHVSIDLTQADPQPQEWTEARPQKAPETGSAPPAGDPGPEHRPTVADDGANRPDAGPDAGPDDGSDRDPAPSPEQDRARKNQPTDPEPLIVRPAPPTKASQPAPPAPPAVAAPAPGRATPPASEGSVQIQAGAFSHLDHARSIVERAKALGVDCRISPMDAAKGTLYRVRCGPFAGTAAAEKAIATLGARGISSLMVRGN